MQDGKIGVDNELPTDDEIIVFMKENGSPKLNELLGTKSGTQICLNYVKRNVIESKISISEACGWLEMSLGD